ncbi:uncharacterized protein [Onthophagus taurus]|uniref:uncharacterized protein n=1 Tax=Onthophagus taurus TaxID=166361 RepID=UPI0039BE5864
MASALASSPFKPSYLINYHKNLITHYNFQSVCTLFRKEITFPFSPVIIAIQERQYNRGKKHYTDYMVSTYGKTKSGKMHAFTEDEHGTRQMAGFNTKNEQFLTIRLKGNVNHYLYGDYHITVYVKITFHGFDDTNTVRYFFEPGLELDELNYVHVQTIEHPNSEIEEPGSEEAEKSEENPEGEEDVEEDSEDEISDGRPILNVAHQPLFIQNRFQTLENESEDENFSAE